MYHTLPEGLQEQEFEGLLAQHAAVLVGAAYTLFDLAIALQMNKDITGSEIDGPKLVTVNSNEVPRLASMQKLLPRVVATVSANWVRWAAETNDNWKWMMHRYWKRAHTYSVRFGKPAPYHKEVSELWMHGPRPRPAGRTPFPEEPC